jgi:hypothetical protein
MRDLIRGDPSRQAAYSSPASRLVNLWMANAPAICSQSFGLARATGTRNFIAT